MVKKDLEEELEIPGGVKVETEGRKIKVSGEKGEVSRKFRSPRISVLVENNKIKISAKNATKREKALLNSYKAHLKNMINGVLEGYIYKLKVCSGHFPMNVSFNNGVFEIKNFYGEKIPRKVELDPSVKVKIDGNNIILEGVSKEVVGQAAANIEQATRRPGYDKRIFQDGIFIFEKAGKKLVE